MNRPRIVTAFGILNLAWTLFSVCGNLQALPFLELEPGSRPDIPAYVPLVEHPAFLAYLKAAIVAQFLLAVPLAVSGVGLLLLKPWGRRLALLWAWISIALAVLGIVLNLTVYLPALWEHAQTMRDGPERTAMLGGALGSSIGSMIGGLGYPIALLIGATRRSFVEAFAPHAEGNPPPVPTPN